MYFVVCLKIPLSILKPPFCSSAPFPLAPFLSKIVYNLFNCPEPYCAICGSPCSDLGMERVERGEESHTNDFLLGTQVDPDPLNLPLYLEFAQLFTSTKPESPYSTYCNFYRAMRLKWERWISRLSIAPVQSTRAESHIYLLLISLSRER